MKKLLTVLIVVPVAFILIACNDNYTAFELLERSHEAMEEVDSMIFEIETHGTFEFVTDSILDDEIDTEIDDVMEETFSSTRAYLDMSTPDEPHMRLEMEDGAESERIIVYFRDGIVYARDIYEYTEGIKLIMDFDEVMAMARPNILETDFNEDDIEDSSVERIDNGYKLSFTLNIEILQPPGEVDFGLYTMVIYLNEDYQKTAIITHMETIATSSISTVTSTISTTLNTRMDIVQIGNVVIDFPDEIDEFEEL